MTLPAVHALAPTQEPPSLVAQPVVTAIFVVIGIFVVKRFGIEPLSARQHGRALKHLKPVLVDLQGLDS